MGGARDPMRPDRHLCDTFEPADRTTCSSRKPEDMNILDFFPSCPHPGSVHFRSVYRRIVMRFLIMPLVISALLAFMAALFRSRVSLYLEHLALRHQLAVSQRTIHRVHLRPTDRLLWGGCLACGLAGTEPWRSSSPVL
jgi:hypothetical protein